MIFRRLFVFPVMAALLVLPAFAQEKSDVIPANPVVGELQGEPVFLSDIMTNGVYEQYVAALNAIESEFQNYALSELAKNNSQFQPIDQFDVSEEQAKTLYEQSGLSRQGDFEVLRPQIEQFIRSQQYMQQFQTAQQGQLAVSHITLPEEPKVRLKIEQFAIRAENMAPNVMVVEFSDYQCPYCARVQQTVQQLMQKYENQVGFAYKHLPLPFHQEADEAANAAECAKDQGKFEAMHKLLFANPQNQLVDDLKQYGRDVEIQDLAKYDKCVDEGTYNQRVQDSIANARSLGINGTPGFVVGLYNPETSTVEGTVISGAMPYELFEQEIEKYLN